MPRVLAVDDARAVRSIVVKQMKELGLEVDEAGDGQEALAKLEDISFDLIILDVTMPVMDGPAMLAKLRESGNKTPVIMLTSEAKRSIITEAMRLGIDDYILKPFKPAELAVKVRTSLKLAGAPPAAPSMEAAPPSEVVAPGSEASFGKQFIDVMIIDDMENVAKRMRQLLPAHVTLASCTSAQSALLACREKVCRVILVDSSMPDVDSAVLANQLHLLQPHAAMVALALKSANNVTEELKSQGFSDVLFKPFTPELIEDFVLQYFDKQELLIREDNLIKIGPFAGRADRLALYFSRLGSLFPPALEQVASACFEDAIVDLTEVSFIQPSLTAKLIIGLTEKIKEFGLVLTVVGTPELKKALQSFEETKELPIFASITDARAAAA